MKYLFLILLFLVSCQKTDKEKSKTCQERGHIRDYSYLGKVKHAWIEIKDDSLVSYKIGHASIYKYRCERCGGFYKEEEVPDSIVIWDHRPKLLSVDADTTYIISEWISDTAYVTYQNRRVK